MAINGCKNHMTRSHLLSPPTRPHLAIASPILLCYPLPPGPPLHACESKIHHCHWGHHCPPPHGSSHVLSQADLTCCWSVLVGNVVVPHYPFVCLLPHVRQAHCRCALVPYLLESRRHICLLVCVSFTHVITPHHKISKNKIGHDWT